MGNTWNIHKTRNNALVGSAAALLVVGIILLVLLLPTGTPEISYSCSDKAPDNGAEDQSGCVETKDGKYKTKEDCKCWKCPATSSTEPCDFDSINGDKTSNECNKTTCQRWGCTI